MERLGDQGPERRVRALLAEVWVRKSESRVGVMERSPSLFWVVSGAVAFVGVRVGGTGSNADGACCRAQISRRFGRVTSRRTMEL